MSWDKATITQSALPQISEVFRTFGVQHKVTPRGQVMNRGNTLDHAPILLQQLEVTDIRFQSLHVVEYIQQTQDGDSDDYLRSKVLSPYTPFPLTMMDLYDEEDFNLPMPSTCPFGTVSGDTARDLCNYHPIAQFCTFGCKKGGEDTDK